MTAHTDPPNHTPVQGDDEQLPCGRLLFEVWDAWERQAADPHLRSCPHCRQAVHGLDQLESAVRGLREDAADASAYDAEPLTRRVMDVVRLELRPGRPLPLGEPDEDLWIMEAVAARSLRAAAETVEGVRAGSCRLIDVAADADPDSGAVTVRLDIHAPAGAVLPHLADRVRERVRQAADRELGMVVAAVDIRVTDLVDTSADGQEGRTS
ncbi:Asp23/Gls24 family envelope stress response protein [Streptomyces lincolnensis]|uniref:Asp23/Gls24 family envelope stress response protein n=1 Tax=Streptomyces lincolnensis TaxID=1915 RepID=UPI001E5214AF|nr:Asp23/Gls24 family envelope stress response protein [Streptomyces lincolnensis]MCD7440777.1 Asp23/Gls24 family envelope stress response protein [Streptomyces lincolnensis]